MSATRVDALPPKHPRAGEGRVQQHQDIALSQATDPIGVVEKPSSSLQASDGGTHGRTRGGSTSWPRAPAFLDDTDVGIATGSAGHQERAIRMGARIGGAPLEWAGLADGYRVRSRST